MARAPGEPAGPAHPARGATAGGAALAGLLLWISTSALAGAPADELLARFVAWFPGEYDNHEQVWQERLDRAEHTHEHTHHIIAPVRLPALGMHVYYVQQYLNGDPAQVYRQRLYDVRFDPRSASIELRIWRLPEETRYRDAHLNPSKLRPLRVTDLIATPGCEVSWRWDERGFFHGVVREEACGYRSPGSQEMIRVADDLRLTEEELWIRDEAFDEQGGRLFGHPGGVHHRNRKVRYFTGWGGVKQKGPAAAADDDAWHSTRELLLHNEGQRRPIPAANCGPSGYSVELARLTYQKTGTAVLKLGLIDDRTGETVAYSWADPGAERIGINLRWAQIGLTLKADPRFGFTPDR